MRDSRLTPELETASVKFNGSIGHHAFAVMSGKGGVGKSIIANNLAMAIGDSGKRTLLVDLDWRMGNQRVLCNAHSERSLNDVICGAASFESSLIQLNHNVSLLAPLPAGDTGNLSEEAICEVLNDKLKDFQSFDSVIYDTGSGLSNELISLSKIVDWTILTLTPELTAISDCYALYKWLLQSEPNVSASLVINRAGGPDEAADIAERFALLTSKFLDRKPYVVGYLSESDMIREAVARQRSLFADEPRVKSAAEFTRLAGRLSALSISQSGAQRLSSLREEVNLKA